MVLDDLDRVPEIERIAQELPGLPIVIDHCFMLNFYRKQADTLAALKRLAALPNMHAKLTFGTHGSARVYPHEDMHRPLKQVIEFFGPDRCVWGSNFPNALWSKGDTYRQNLTLFTEELGLGSDDLEGVLSRTALKLWFPHHAAQRAMETAGATWTRTKKGRS
jgi:predicted TIM-barrel fold metal-dependent hydrolase